MERRLCPSRTPAGSTHLPWRQRCWPARWDNQGLGNPNAWPDSRNESQLYRVQISANQVSSLAKGKLVLSKYIISHGLKLKTFFYLQKFLTQLLHFENMSHSNFTWTNISNFLTIFQLNFSIIFIYNKNNLCSIYFHFHHFEC